MADPALYDVARALGDAARFRAQADRDPVIAGAVALADQLSHHMSRHFPDPEDARIAGHALVIASAALGGLPLGMPLLVGCNIAGLAGQRLAMDGGVDE